MKDFAELTRNEYAKALHVSHDDSCPACRVRPFSQVVDELIRLAGLWPVGTVVERRGYTLHERSQLRPAAG
ncbi:hypothetical protein E3O25_06220 [Cryobacterium sp. TMT1-3]|uniref:DUF7715 family protein n=1 Tax=Cryobacterium sp. TMT1-3 TaxID=1259237 RepID=UPI0011017128|nr:hypothetical protein [Cryobacterium sp. TMT1-3]TFC28791.1 hypothetical protein E3O25_06220 [Cryobacterium sp. TMT1-3]